LLDQIFDSLVSGVEVFRTNACVICFPRIARFIGTTRIERMHVGISPATS